MLTKVCSKCKEVKAIVFFSKDSSRKDRLQRRCKECEKAICKAWREANKELKASTDKAWRDSNPERGVSYNAKRRAKKLQATAPWADNQAIAHHYEKAAILTRETGKQWHVDHIDPLQSDLVCGLHVAENLQVLPAEINLSKSNKFRPYRFCFLTNATYYLD